ncbi:MAG: hypothetical protein V8S95_02575 [Odoribacter sp.]
MSKRFLTEDEIDAKINGGGPVRNRQSSIMVAGFIQKTGSSSISVPDGFHYNTDYVESISYQSANKGIALNIRYKTEALARRYCRMLQLTPTIQQGDITSENYLSCTYYNIRSGQTCSYVIYMYDTNNGANFREEPFGCSIFVPNVEAEY